ncbi:MAG: hypothetical protein HZB53_07720 [Chloroflexi bacterium]|nr:hypothetical protein [Chloroflexota bacterium]
MIDPKTFYLPMAHILAQTRIVRERLLPRPGEAEVSADQRVEPVDVVARAFVPDMPRVYNIAQMFKVPSSRAHTLLLKHAGEEFAKDEIIARHKRTLEQARVIRAPAPGRLLAEHEGEVLLEMMPAPLELKAGIKGVVANASRFGVVIQVAGALVQGLWGNGKTNFGVLKVLGAVREQPLTAELIDVSCLGTIVVAGGALQPAGLKQAEAQQVRGIICGSMPATLCAAALAAPFPVVITEGFGAVPMAGPAYELCRASNSREASLDAVARTRWGASRPELVVPLPARDAAVVTETPRAYAAIVRNVRVRVTAGDEIGRTGHIASDQVRAREFESGIRVRAAEVEFDDGETGWIPVNNLEAYI